MTRRRLAYLTAAAALALPATALAQPGEPPADLVLGETIDVRVVNVEAVVNDADGERVTGLGPDDFRLFVDGEEVPLDYFSEIREGVTHSPQAAAGRPAPRARVPEGPVATNHLVFVDNLFTVRARRDRILTSLERELRQLRPADRMAIVSFDGRRLELDSGWSSDRTALAASFAHARERPSLGLHRLAELRQADDHRQAEREIIKTIEILMSDDTGSPNAGTTSSENAALSGGGDEDFQFLEEATLNRTGAFEAQIARRLAAQVRKSTLAAAAAMRALADIDGRRTLLLLSGGWTERTLEYLVADGKESHDLTLEAAISQAGVDDSRPLAVLTDAANRLGFTLYPIDVAGAELTDSIQIGAATDNFFVVQQGEIADEAAARRTREDFHEDAMVDLAFETGGAALLNAQRERALPLVAADTRDYYWLGFTRGSPPDDRLHTIRVELSRPDLRVRARRSFHDLSPDHQAAAQADLALLFENALEPTTVQLVLGETVATRRRLEVPLDVRIPLDAVTVVEQGGVFVAEVDVTVSAADESGATQSSLADRVAIRGSTAPAPGQYFTYSTQLSLRNRDHKVVVTVRDRVTGTVLGGTTEISGTGGR